jgi:hypothetical protein
MSSSSILSCVAAWAVPFAVSCLFFGPGGTMSIPRPLFKSIMVVVGMGSAAWLLARRRPGSAAAGAVEGAAMMAVGWALDAAILLRLTGQTVAEYAADIGLQYVAIPLIGAAIGSAAAAAAGAAAGAGKAA